MSSKWLTVSLTETQILMVFHFSSHSRSTGGPAGRKPDTQHPGVQITMETYTAYVFYSIYPDAVPNRHAWNRQNAEVFYQVDRPVQPTTVDLENNLNNSDDDATSQHKNSSQKSFSPI